jgi:hypothetical protein
MGSEIIGFAKVIKEKKMVKKGLFSAAIFIIALLVLGSCVSAPAAKQAYPTGTELYPAVYGTFSELYPKAKFLDIDFYNNKYVITGITGLALTTPLSYDMTVKLSSSGEIDISYANIYMKDSTGRWGKSEAFGMYNYNKAAADVAARMTAIANDPATLDRYERAAMADIKFVYSIMKNFTGLAFKDFIDKYAKGSVFNINGPISDVREVNREIDGKMYKYVITLTEKLSEESADFYFSSLLSEYVYCTLYTNQDDVIRLSKTAVLSVNGTLIGASQGSLGASLRLELVDVK